MQCELQIRRSILLWTVGRTESSDFTFLYCGEWDMLLCASFWLFYHLGSSACSKRVQCTLKVFTVLDFVVSFFWCKCRTYQARGSNDLIQLHFHCQFMSFGLVLVMFRLENLLYQAIRCVILREVRALPQL